MNCRITYLLLLTIFSSCSIKNNIYLTRFTDNKGSWNNFTIHFTENNNAVLTTMNRRGDKLYKNQIALQETGNKEFSNLDRSIKVNLSNKYAELLTKDNNITLNKIKSSNRDSNIDTIYHILTNNYIIHINEHQKTKFELKQDSLSFLYRNLDTIPYEKEKWFLFEIGNEVFLTYTFSDRNIYRVEYKNSVLTQLICQKGKCVEFEVKMESKKE